ncbi:MAG TPA: hypothetical protein VJ464_08160 [Blastocatellia bacterium]|nr:hypothetical protein [Blastocatellia bacterium]
MKLNNQRRIVLAAAFTCLLAVGGMSKPGRTMLSRVTLAVKTGEVRALWSGAPASATVATAAADVEQRARAKHGWGTPVLNSVAHGVMTSYDRNGAVTGRTGITLYRKYPDRLRVEMGLGMPTEVLGFDHQEAWKAGAATLTAQQARDIRAWLRASPERLFVTRAGGASYREAGRRIEDYRPATPWQGATRQVPTVLEQVEVEDLIGPMSASRRQSTDRRLIDYYVDKENAVVVAARWLEPEDPQQVADDPATASLDVRVDFANWRQVEGVLWPMQVTHWLGGRVDFRVDFDSVRLNQQMPDTLFQKPN